MAEQGVAGLFALALLLLGWRGAISNLIILVWKRLHEPSLKAVNRWLERRRRL